MSVRNLPETVGIRFSGSSGEDDEPDLANQRNQGNENPSGTLADIMHTSHADRQAGQNRNQAENRTEDVYESRNFAIRTGEQPAKQGENNIHK